MRTFDPRVLMFDLDGTLVDSYADAELCWSQWASSVGVLDNFDFPRLFGGRRSEIVGALLPGLSEEEIDRHVEQVRLAERESTHNVAARPGVHELMHRLDRDSWGIVTSNDREVAQARIRAAGLPLPSILFSADEVTRGKPHPDGFLMAAGALQAHPHDCLVFEDSPAGIRAAKAANMVVLAVRFKHPDAVLDAADAIIDDFTRLSIIRAGARYQIAISPGQLGERDVDAGRRSRGLD